MKVVLSIGYGRLHLVTTAEWLAKCDVAIRLVCGWVPRRSSGFLVKLCSVLVGRDLSFGLKKRLIVDDKIKINSMPCPEFFDEALRLICRVTHVSTHVISAFTWSLFGWFSRRFIKDADVFHCRSGAGQGGAIRVAKRRGMKVLVDHSALHPAQSELNLEEEYGRWGQTIAIAPHLGVWKNVIKDCREADMLMVNADHIRDSFVERGFPFDRIRVVRLGVRDDFFGLKASYHIGSVVKLLYTGNFSILKGAEYLLEAFYTLRTSGMDVELDVVGSVGIPKRLREKFRDLPIRYHGVIPQDSLKKFLAAADIYVFPSLADGCAQSGMEAMSAGLPVIATYQSGLPIEDGKTGCVVQMKNSDEIVTAVVKLISDERLREKLGRAAAKLIAENYTWKNYAQNVIKVYHEMMEVI